MTNHQAVVLSGVGLSSAVVGLVATLGAAALITGGAATAQSGLADPTTSGSLAAVGKRCHGKTVDVSPAMGSVKRVRGISCRTATEELGRLVIHKGRLVPSEGANWYWSCRVVGQYYDGVKYRCTYGRMSFRAMVGA